MKSMARVALCGFVLGSLVSAQELPLHGPVAAKGRDLRQQFGHMAFVKTAVVLVDQRVGLSIEQNRKLTKALIERWDTANLKLNAATLQGGLPPGFPDAAVVKQLTAEQQKIWKLVRSENEKPILLGQGQDPAPLRRAIANIADARTAALESQFELDARQLQKFKLAAKGATTTALRKRLAGQEHMQQPFAPGEKIDPELYECWVCDQASLLVCHTRWTRWVRSALKQEQRPKYDELLKFRAAQAQDAQLHYLVATNAQRMNLTGAEERKLLALLKKLIPIDQRSLRYSLKTMLAMKGLTATQLQSAIPKEASEAFVAIFGGADTFKDFPPKQ
ncbi:MAG: hypothetical protein AB8G99_21520 [Planctomycetaceae bacterium]